MAIILQEIPTPHRLQLVSTIAVWKRIITCMVQDKTTNGFPGLYIPTITAFPEHFHALQSANLVRASQWWAQREQYCNEGEKNIISPPISCSRSQLGKQKQLCTKVAIGRGPKRSAWVLWMYPKLLVAFEQFKSIGVKFSSRLLIELTMSILLDPTSSYTIQSRDPKDNVLLTSKLTPSWIQQFMHVHNIVLLSQRGRLTCSLEKELQIERATTYHLGVLHRGFEIGVFDENLMENINETHFVVNLDKGRTFGFRGDTTIKYAKVVSEVAAHPQALKSRVCAFYHIGQLRVCFFGVNFLFSKILENFLETFQERCRFCTRIHSSY